MSQLEINPTCMRELSMQNFKKPHSRMSYGKTVFKFNKNSFHQGYTTYVENDVQKRAFFRL